MGMRFSTLMIAALSLILIAAISAFYFNSRPDDQVTNPIDWVLVESLYGQTFESISGLAEVDSVTSFLSEKAKLEEALDRDPFILSAHLTDARLLELTREREAPFLAQYSRYGCSSEGRDMNIERLMFCGVTDEDGQRLRTLQYRRRSMGEAGSDRHVINAHFDIDKMTDQYATILDRARDYAERNRNTYDENIPGRWRIVSKFHLTGTERVDLQGDLQINATEAAGVYAFVADIQATATLREGKSEFALDLCTGRAEPCSWSASAAGTLKIVGNRVLLVYDDDFWRSDRLDLEAGLMSGENGWGEPSVYRRIAPEN